MDGRESAWMNPYVGRRAGVHGWHAPSGGADQLEELLRDLQVLPAHGTTIHPRHRTLSPSSLTCRCLLSLPPLAVVPFLTAVLPSPPPSLPAPLSLSLSHLEPSCCPMLALTTPLSTYSWGVDGSSSVTGHRHMHAISRKPYSRQTSTRTADRSTYPRFPHVCATLSPYL